MREEELVTAWDESAPPGTLLSRVQQGLVNAGVVRRWWHRAEQSGDPPMFPLIRVLHHGSGSSGALGNVTLEQGLLPVFGIVQEMVFEGRKRLAYSRQNVDWLCAQVRVFALRYFMRVAAAVRSLERYCPPQGRNVPRFLEPLSWYPVRSGPEGMGYRQLWYQRQDGELGAFAPRDQRAIVDVREVGPLYKWIVLAVDINNFTMQLPLAGPQGSVLQLPIRENCHVVLAPDFVVDRRNPEPGVAGEFGFGYAILPPPPDGNLAGRGLSRYTAYGPSKLLAGFDMFLFRVMESGEVLLREIFVTNQPVQLVNLDPVIDWGYDVANAMTLRVAEPVLRTGKQALSELAASFDPVFTGVQALNAVTGGFAASNLCISRPRLVFQFMALHCLVEYDFFLELQQLWDLIPDWTDEKALPPWVTDPC
jgi:hypothetical protein